MGSLLNYFLIFLVINLSFSTILDKCKSYENYKIFLIQNGKGVKDLLDTLKDRDNNFIYGCNKTTTEVLVAPNLMKIFYEVVSKNQLNVQLIVDNYAYLLQENKIIPIKQNIFGWDAYYDVDNIYWYLKKMNHQYPEWTDLIVGGMTYEGRKILGLRINTKKLESNLPIMFIESGIHAREWITPATTTYLINQLLTSSDPDIQKLRDTFDWRIFPTVNPDGYHYSHTFDRMWRKTRSRSPSGCFGADPNRNWDYNWLTYETTNNTCDYETYGGSKPFSEIETRTLSEYISSLGTMVGYVALHANAQMLLIPYSDSKEHISNYDDLIRIGNTSLNYVYKVNGKMYDGPSTAPEILYKASGCSMDWVRQTLGTPLVYTFELRGIYFHWPASRINEQGDEVVQMMMGLANEAEALGYI